MTALFNHPCPCCGSMENRSLFGARDPMSGDEFPIVQCRACGLARVDPRPEGAALAAYYPADYYGKRHPLAAEIVMALRAAKLGPPPPGARLLDIGCGRGEFITACRSRGWEGTGVEQAGSPVMEMRETLGLEVVTPEELADLPDGSYDAVTLWHVLEHLPDPRATLAQSHRLLNPGGRLLVEVPNFGGWQAVLGKERWFHLDVPRHLLHFTKESLAGLLEAAGFKPCRWGTLSIEYDAFGLAQTILNRVCRHQNHLFQTLIGRPLARSPRDTLLSFGLILPVGALAAAVSLLAPLAGRGGVLRTLARRR